MTRPINTKCATCPISCGCSWGCLRGDDLAEIYVLRAALANMLDLCTTMGNFKNGVTHQGIDEGEVWASGVFDQAYAALNGAGQTAR